MLASDYLRSLVDLTRELGDPVNEYAILAEGNTSTRMSEDRFAIKASGVRMEGIDAEGFVGVRIEPLMELLTSDDDVPLEDVRARLVDARTDDLGVLSPSIETLVHVACITLAGADYVGHTHPTASNGLLCSKRAEEMFEGVLFPDEAVILGAESLFVPYASPGLPLGRSVARGLHRHIQTYGEAPKLILLGNHGIVALGSTAAEISAITSMAVKSSQIRAAAHVIGGPAPLTRDEVLELVGRTDETARRTLLFGDDQRPA